MTALNPLAVLSRGYGAVYGKEGRVVSSVDDISVGEKFSIDMSDGTVMASALEVKKKLKNVKED